MLDDVERRSLLVEPSRKDPLPAALRIADVELDEGSGQSLHLPGRGRLAGAQPDDRVAHAHRLAGLERDRARDAVALVDEPEHRHPLRHRSRAGSDGGDGLRDVDRPGLADRLPVTGAGLLCAPIAAGERGQSEESGAEGEPHA
jgi:hypothetical protein